LKLDQRRLKKIVEALLVELGYRERDLSILFIDNRKITDLNKKCFGRNYATNVISFSYMDGYDYEALGDIAVSVEKAKDEADKADVPFYERVVALVIHGLVHILGFDHEQGPNEARRMKYREKKLFVLVKESDVYKELVGL
jgi:rRNA maturation RNase YbeY